MDKDAHKERWARLMRQDYKDALAPFVDKAPDIAQRVGSIIVLEARRMALVEVRVDGVALKFSGMFFILDLNKYDGKDWLHLSISRLDRTMPSYNDLSAAHGIFFGDERISYQIFAPAKEHVNIHATCLHLWSPVGHRPTPDFTLGSGSI